MPHGAIMLSFIFVALIGCAEDDTNSGFSSFGTSVSPGATGSSDNNSNESQSESTESSDEGGPTVSGADAWFTEVTGYGEVAEIHVYFDDSDAGVDGGSLKISSDSGNITQDIDSSDSQSLLILEDGEITALVDGIATDAAITFTVQITDSAGLLSNSVETTASPTSD